MDVHVRDTCEQLPFPEDGAFSLHSIVDGVSTLFRAAGAGAGTVS